MYKLARDQITGEIRSVNKINEDGSGLCIPFSEGNTDYQEYLKWVEKGNTPQPADTPTQGAA